MAKKRKSKNRITKTEWKRFIVFLVIGIILFITRYYTGLKLPENLDFVNDLIVFLIAGILSFMFYFFMSDILGIKVPKT